MRVNSRFSRRRMMRSLAGGALVMATVPILSACTSTNDDDDTETTDAGSDDSTADEPDGDTPIDDQDEESDGTASDAEVSDDEDPDDDTANGSDDDSEIGGEVTVYSGRGEDLVQSVFDRFEEETGIQVNVRYGDTAELAAAILEEGSNTPADVFFAQDAGALGALSREGIAREIPEDILELVDPRFRSPEGLWVGASGRARVVIYNTDEVSEDDLPDSILDYADSRWENVLGWAPSNGSFQAWVTALRLTEGDDVARQWLEDIDALNPRVYENNTSAVLGTIAGEAHVSFVNHYYLYREMAEAGGDVSAQNYYFPAGDIGGMMNVAGLSVLEPSSNVEQAEALVEYLLQQEAQEYFADETFEYPLALDVPADDQLPPLEDLETPEIDLSDLEDLEGTLALMREAGLL